MPDSDAPRPSYLDPPVIEVVLSAQFEPLKQFGLPHFGRLWSKFQREFPLTEDRQAIGRMETVWYSTDWSSILSPQSVAHWPPVSQRSVEIATVFWRVTAYYSTADERSAVDSAENNGDRSHRGTAGRSCRLRE